jgi:sugar-specific transcriptional regulator TrmB
MMVNKSLRAAVTSIGLTSKHALVCETLLSNGVGTPLILSRATTLNRGSLYRYLDELINAGFVEEVMEGKTKKYVATDPNNLRMLITKQEAKLSTLKEEIPLLIKQLMSKAEIKAEGTQVKYYRGVEGLRQMLWNIVSSGAEFVGLGYENWNTSVGKKFAEKLRQKVLDNQIVTREILNEVDADFTYTELGKKYGSFYEHRAIPAEVIEIHHDTYIYNDVFAFYYHYQGELFGVEIHNKEITKTEKQMFEILWKVARE